MSLSVVSSSFKAARDCIRAIFASPLSENSLWIICPEVSPPRFKSLLTNSREMYLSPTLVLKKLIQITIKVIKYLQLTNFVNYFDLIQ